ncbi:hypothetical protein [Limosilactobacillus caecicola]|uniref:hypothetical protein n=1 Tax=Limosilactobacillus caecicola TaxID=2941332 RepID=UPI00203A977B|nr:hypothetical protein [Limosilactobacillus caecicola]
MSYDITINKLIIAKLHDVKDVRGTFYLPACNQQDVMDTVNFLHAKYPKIFVESEISYDGLADITYDISSWNPHVE